MFGIVQRWARTAASVAACVASQGCATTSTPSAIERAEAAPEVRAALAARERATAEPVGGPAAGEGTMGRGRTPARPQAGLPLDLARGVDRRSLEREALARSPELAAATLRARALTAAGRAQGSLPDPMLSLSVVQVPLERPYAIDDAMSLAVGLSQSFPAAGALGMREEARGHQALAVLASRRARALELVREVDHAFADYVEVTARRDVRVGHRALLERAVTVAVARTAAGASVSDATQAALSLARLEADVATDSGLEAAAKARINGLLLRSPGAPLGPPVRSPLPRRPGSVSGLAATARETRPEVEAADELRKAAEVQVSASEREAAVPAFGLGVSYFAPVGAMARHGYGVSVSATLPWLWGPRGDEAESGRESVRAASADAEAIQARVDADVALAAARVEGAELRLAALRDIARPAARRAIDLAEAGYQSGGVDLLRLLAAADGEIAVDLDVVSAEGALERALADLDRAVGGSSPIRTSEEASR